MGVSIEFDRVAIAFPFETQFGRTEQHYLLAHETGSDNTLTHDGKIARDWNYYTVGDQRDVISTIALAAGDIEGGMVRYQNGSTKPENYIKNWRKTMEDDSMSVEEFTDRFHLAELVICRPKKVTDLPDDARDAFEQIQSEWRRTQPDEDSFLERPIYRADITVETLQLFERLSDETHVEIDF